MSAYVSLSAVEFVSWSCQQISQIRTFPILREFPFHSLRIWGLTTQTARVFGHLEQWLIGCGSQKDSQINLRLR